MGFLIGLLIVFEVLISILLIGIILLQKSREQGLGMAFGANVGETLFGSRAGNVLTKGTIILGSLFAVNTLLIGLLYARQEQSVIERQLAREAASGAAAEMAKPSSETSADLDPQAGAAVQPGVVDLTNLATGVEAKRAEGEAAPESPEGAPGGGAGESPVPDRPDARP